MDLSTNYLGLNLMNPLIVGSSGLTADLENLKEIEKFGAGAIVLKSLFEEDIIMEMKENISQMTKPANIYPEIFDAFDFSTIEDSVSKYLFLIEDAKKTLTIPIIASINCIDSNEWTTFAKRIQDAGADALELNIFIPPTDMERTGIETEKIYFDIIEKVKKEITIPISIKISYFFTNLANMILRLSQSGTSGIVLFNRFYHSDVNIDNLSIVPAPIFSAPTDLYQTMRWIAIMSKRANCDLAASTGAHDSTSFIKLLLTGAKVVQFTSTLYIHGIPYVSKLITELEDWMEKHKYNSIKDFNGILSADSSKDPGAFMRVQFMKNFSGKK